MGKLHHRHSCSTCMCAHQPRRIMLLMRLRSSCVLCTDVHNYGHDHSVLHYRRASGSNSNATRKCHSWWMWHQGLRRSLLISRRRDHRDHLAECLAVTACPVSTVLNHHPTHSCTCLHPKGFWEEPVFLQSWVSLSRGWHRNGSRWTFLLSFSSTWLS